MRSCDLLFVLLAVLMCAACRSSAKMTAAHSVSVSQSTAARAAVLESEDITWFTWLNDTSVPGSLSLPIILPGSNAAGADSAQVVASPVISAPVIAAIRRHRLYASTSMGDSTINMVDSQFKASQPKDTNNAPTSSAVSQLFGLAVLMIVLLILYLGFKLYNIVQTLLTHYRSRIL